MMVSARQKLHVARTFLILAMSPVVLGQTTRLEPPPATSPGTQPATQPDARHPMLDRVAEVAAMHVTRAHGNTQWRQHQALQADFSVEVDAKPVAAGTMILAVHLDRVRIDLNGEGVALRDGDTIWLSPNEMDAAKAKACALTWPFLLTAPFHLQDTGAKQSDSRRQMIDNKRCGRFSLTFDESAATPVDSFVCYWTIDDRILKGIAGSFDLGIGSVDTHPSQHVVVFEEYTKIDGVTLPTSWSFWRWSDAQGQEGEQLGVVKISNSRFMTPEENTFAPPTGARSIEIDSQ